MDKKIISSYIDKDLKLRLDKYRQEKGINFSVWVSNLIDKELVNNGY